MSLTFPHGRNFYMLRHAETEDNKNKVVSGKGSDTMLTTEGRRQAQLMQPVLAGIMPAISYVVTSEMRRTIETAKLICDCSSLRDLPHFVESGINERAYGAAEGMADVERSRILNSGGVIEGEESKESLRMRTVLAIANHLEIRDGVPLFITHGGNIRRMLELASAKGTDKEKIANCGLYEFITPGSENGRWQLKKM